MLLELSVLRFLLILPVPAVLFLSNVMLLLALPDQQVLMKFPGTGVLVMLVSPTLPVLSALPDQQALMRFPVMSDPVTPVLLTLPGIPELMGISVLMQFPALPAVVMMLPVCLRFQVMPQCLLLLQPQDSLLAAL